MRKDYNWTAGSRRSSADAVWPPRGLHLAVSLRVDPLACAALRGITVDVHYEMYEAVPALSKWITVSVDDHHHHHHDHHNHHDHHDNHDEGSISSTSSPPKPPRLLNNVVVEQLGVNPPFSPQAWDPSVAQSFLQPGKLGSPVYAGSGQLHLEIDMEYATWVEWDDTFTKSTRGSVQPTLTAAFNHSLRIPLTDLMNSADHDDESGVTGGDSRSHQHKDGDEHHHHDHHHDHHHRRHRHHHPEHGPRPIGTIISLESL